MPTPPLLTHNNREFVDFEKSNEVDQRAETFATVEQFLGRYADPRLARPIKTVRFFSYNVLQKRIMFMRMSIRLSICSIRLELETTNLELYNLMIVLCISD